MIAIQKEEEEKERDTSIQAGTIFMQKIHPFVRVATDRIVSIVERDVKRDEVLVILVAEIEIDLVVHVGFGQCLNVRQTSCEH